MISTMQHPLLCHSVQGLSATNEQLGANAAATATEFDTFEDLLALSTTGDGAVCGGWDSCGLLSCFNIAAAAVAAFQLTAILAKQQEHPGVCMGTVHVVIAAWPWRVVHLRSQASPPLFDGCSGYALLLRLMLLLLLLVQQAAEGAAAAAAAATWARLSGKPGILSSCRPLCIMWAAVCQYTTASTPHRHQGA